MQDDAPSNDDAIVLGFLDIKQDVKWDSYKTKVIPYVSEYISALRERMYGLIFKSHI